MAKKKVVRMKVSNPGKRATTWEMFVGMTKDGGLLATHQPALSADGFGCFVRCERPATITVYDAPTGIVPKKKPAKGRKGAKK